MVTFDGSGNALPDQRFLKLCFLTTTRMKHGRKVRRLALSCSTCRKKKIKCDRQRPRCSGCLKSNSPCVFQDPFDSNVNFELLEDEDSKNAKGQTSENNNFDKSASEATSGELYDLSSYFIGYTERFADISLQDIKYHGPTCWKCSFTKLRELPGFRDAFEILLRHKREQMKAEEKESSLSLVGDDLPTLFNRLSIFMPTFKEIKAHISNVFSVESTLTNCFNYRSIMEFVYECLDCEKNVPVSDASPIKLSILLFMSCFGDPVRERRREVARIATSIVLHRLFDIGIFNLQALVLLWVYESRYGEISTTDYMFSRRATLFNHISYAGIRMGLFNDIDQIYSATGPALRTTLKRIHKFIVFETYLQCFQLGIPTYLLTSGNINMFISDDESTEFNKKIFLLKDLVSINENLKTPVNLLAFIERTHYFLLSQRPTLFERSIIDVIDHEVFYLLILTSLYSILIECDKPLYREKGLLEGLRYFLVATLLLRKIISQIISISSDNTNEFIYGNYASKFTFLNNFMTRILTLQFAILQFDDYFVQNSILVTNEDIDQLLDTKIIDLLNKSDDGLRPFLGNRLLIRRVVEISIPQDFEKRARHFTRAIKSFQIMSTALSDCLEPKSENSQEFVTYTGETIDQGASLFSSAEYDDFFQFFLGPKELINMPLY